MRSTRALTYLVGGKDLFAVGAEVHHRTILCPAEQIWLVCDVNQADPIGAGHLKILLRPSSIATTSAFARAGPWRLTLYQVGQVLVVLVPSASSWAVNGRPRWPRPCRSVAAASAPKHHVFDLQVIPGRAGVLQQRDAPAYAYSDLVRTRL